MRIKRYYILEHKGRTVNITRDALLLGPMPVLWCNDGMYALIPGAILEELFNRKIPEGTGTITRLWWEQAYELEPDVGRLLCDKSYNQADDSHD